MHQGNWVSSFRRKCQGRRGKRIYKSRRVPSFWLEYVSHTSSTSISSSAMADHNKWTAVPETNCILLLMDSCPQSITTIRRNFYSCCQLPLMPHRCLALRLPHSSQYAPMCFTLYGFNWYWGTEFHSKLWNDKWYRKTLRFPYVFMYLLTSVLLLSGVSYL